MKPRPSFDSLPLREGDPPHSAWGLYGENDQLGCLNLLTPENTLAASQEVKTGVRLSLDPPLDALVRPGVGRACLEHDVILRQDVPGIYVHDDTLTLNTQSSAQWDSFRHVSYFRQGKFYNNTSPELISGSNADKSVLGIHSWLEAGGIAGRGVLLDYLSYAQAKGKEYKQVGSDHAITVEELQACAAHQGTEIRYGDILIVRSGYWHTYNQLSHEERLAWCDGKSITHVGVQPSRDMAKWLWDSGISACAGDAVGWEAMPPKPGLGLDNDHILHEVMLAGWGMPIGELWNLEALAEECKRQNRWSFFLTSAPLHVRGGVASPPNAIAIF